MRHVAALAIAVLLNSPLLCAETTVAPAPHAPRPRPEPAITFQTHSVERVLTEFRTVAELIGGERMLKAFNKGLKEKLGEKGFDGLDLGRPIVGYVLLAPKLEDSTLVVAVPVSGEKSFLEFSDRVHTDLKPSELGDGRFDLQNADFGPAHLRFADGYAYMAFGKDAEQSLEAKAIVPVHKLYDPAEPGLLAVKLHFDRVTLETKLSFGRMLLDLKKEYADNLNGNRPEVKLVRKAFGEVEKLALRYLGLLGGADSLTLRVGIDPQSTDLVVEATLSPKPGTPLAKEIAAHKPAPNRFAGLITPDTVAGFAGTGPFFSPESRNVWITFCKLAQVSVADDLPQGAKPVANELFKGLIRTTKAGEGDIAAAIRGPDASGYYTAVGAVSFENPAALEKEFRKYMEADGPTEDEGEFQWDAAKVGQVSIHTFKLAGKELPKELQALGGDCVVAFAFAPRGIYVAIGPDPVGILKDTLNAKPVESPAAEVFVNPAKLGKLAERAGDKDLTVEKMIGWDDKLVSAGSLQVISGNELTVRLSLNLRILPRAMLIDGIENEEEAQPVPMPVPNPGLPRVQPLPLPLPPPNPGLPAIRIPPPGAVPIELE